MQLAEQRELPIGNTRLGAQLTVWLRAAGDWSAGLIRGNATVSPNSNTSGQILKEVIAHLDLLNHQTEQDFLLIGRKLTEFMAAVRQISCESTALSGLISGERGLRASAALTGALNRSRAMRTRAEEGSGLLAVMRDEAARLKQTLSGFGGTISAFRTLGVLTRIETALLGNAGADFGNLADDVKSLARTVQDRVESALETATLLIPPIEGAMQEIATLEQDQERDLPSVISGVMASLASYRDIRQHAHDASLRLKIQSEAISQSFVKLIVSIQFHDITRQQVEHVIEALQRLLSEPDRRDATAILAVQSSQLADAGEKFGASVAAVAHNLEKIVRHVHEMAEESRTMSGLSEDEKNSFFLEMERGCTAVLSSLSHCADSERVTDASSNGMAEIIGQMRRSLEEIEAVEIQVQRMAMNASIRAAHIGVSGDALGVLAAAMQQTAFDCAQRSAVLTKSLDAMSHAATRLSGAHGPADGDSSESLEELRTAVGEMHSTSEQSFARIAQIVLRGSRLSEDLSATRNGFTVGELFADAINRARGRLTTLEKQYPAGGSVSSEHRDVALKDFSRHYTMQAEREVHEGVFGIAAASSAEESEGMADNVELF